MGRRARGSIWESRGTVFLSLTLDKRTSVALSGCTNRDEVEVRRNIILGIVQKLKAESRLDLAESICRQAGAATAETLAGIVTLVNGLGSGGERLTPKPVIRPNGASSKMTVRQFAEKLWTNNELARQFRKRVKAIDHAPNIRKLEKHIYPVVFDGRSIADTPLDEFTLDHADQILAETSLPERSIRHVAQVIHRLFALAEYPARVIAHSPLPRGWLPKANDQKAFGYLYPKEDELLLANTKVPLVRRLLYGFCMREGPRKSNAVTIEWTDLVLDMPDGGGYITLDKTKSGHSGSWALDPGTAEAFRRWRRICPSERFVFPSEALPRARRAYRGQHLVVGQLAENLRDDLLRSGVDRAKLFETTGHRQKLRAHDLRATFVTLALGNGRTDDWVKKRTGHRSDAMLNRYKREAETVQELHLGWFKPLHEAIPELAAMPAESAATTATEHATITPAEPPSEEITSAYRRQIRFQRPKSGRFARRKLLQSQPGAKGGN
jgi:integrase